MQPLSPRQRDVLGCIRQHLSATGRLPSLSELGADLGGIRPPTVLDHIRALERKGWLTPHPASRAGYTLAHSAPEHDLAAQPCAIPLAGLLVAGLPLQAPEQSGSIALRLRMAEDPSRIVALRVSGWGFVGDGLLDGDVVVVQRGETPTDGSTVIVLTDADVPLVKRVARVGEKLFLDPLQPAGQPAVLTAWRAYGQVLYVQRELSTPPRADEAYSK
ncbi:MAG: hypothetical protein M1296_00995 [Chloroflexi bacterium]|nr:hypothetical protein [Chloroflexota bacterium]